MTPLDKTIEFATNQIVTLCYLYKESPLADFEDFFNANHHLTKEIGYDLGMIQGYAEALGTAGMSLGFRLDYIIDIMQDIFDRA